MFIDELSIQNKVDMLHGLHTLPVRSVPWRQFEDESAIYDILECVDRQKLEYRVPQLQLALS
jgi:hypothetical protein